MKLILALACLGGVSSSLAPPQYVPLPLGEIRPTGWLYEQLVVQANGISGHMHEFYDLVKDTDWWGGKTYYSYLEEAGSYWFNAMVPMSVLVDHPVILAKTYDFLNYVLDNQDESGWLGPEVGTDKPRWLWGRYPFFLGAIQMTEWDPSLTDRVVTAMHKFVVLANQMLKNGEGIEHWASTRWEDFVLALQWMHDYHARGQEELLVDTMIRLKWSGAPWEQIFSEEYFPKVAVENLDNPFNEELFWHGVNMAEGMKALPATYRFTHNLSDLTAASDSWELMFKYHGRPSGAFGADEMLSGLAANRGSELCLVVELMFSGSYMFQVSGDLKYIDRIERVTYNALPATITSDMWGRQYLQQQNQVAAKNMTPNPFPEDGPESNIFGLEPNYPCCTVNFPQGWPKFITNAFVVTPDRTTLIQVYLGPFNVSSVLAGNNRVTVDVKTQYPFNDVLETTITATKPFNYHVRIPSWISGGSLSLDGAEPEPLVEELTSGGLLRISVKAGTSRIVMALSAPITVESRPHSSVAIHRGPLNYAYDIPRTETIIATDPREARAVDLQIDPVGEWQYAIDPSTVHYHLDPEVPVSLPSPVFETGGPPVSISVVACLIEWPVAGDLFAADPPEYPDCIGEEKRITLTPYGSTKLRISEFPVFESKRAVVGEAFDVQTLLNVY